MVDALAKLDVVLMAISLLEASAVGWLRPLGVSRGQAEKQRLGRFLVPPLALAVLLYGLVVPPSHYFATPDREYLMVASTPVFMGGTVYFAVLMVRAWRQLPRVSRTRRHAPH